MEHYLHLFFDPDVGHKHPAPAGNQSGSVDHHNLRYAENVVVDQVVAEFRPMPGHPPDTRLLLQERVLPAGEGTRPNPENPDQLLATVDGHACFRDGLVCVVETLRIPGDVDMHTGNIEFVGDLVVEGDVLSGFKVQARNVLVKGTIDGAEIWARRELEAQTGIKGEKTAFIQAGGDIRTPFCENATLVTRRNILVEGSSLHCDLYAGQSISVLDRLQGGAVYCLKDVLVQGRLGGGTGTETLLVLGFDPDLLLRLDEIEEAVQSLKGRLRYLETQSAKDETNALEFSGELDKARNTMQALLDQKQVLEHELEARDGSRSCSLAVPGEVRPGVSITMGEVSIIVDDYLQDVRFTLTGDTITSTSPALETT